MAAAGNSTIITSIRAGIKGDSSGLCCHWDNVFMVHHEACCGVTAEVNLKSKRIR